MNNVFGFRDQLISAYSSFSRSFSRIAAPDIRDEVERQYADGRYWPEPLVQINPNYQRKGTVQQLVAEGVLHRACADLFQVGKAEGAPQPLHLYAHQMQALAKGQGKQSYVVTTGTGSGKSLSFFIPVIDRILKAKTQDKTARTRAVVIYPMNALANSQLEELDKFLYGYPAGQQPFTVARYTGQESKAERDAIANNPPDILLTNFMMLELILTRFDEVDRRVVDHCQGLEFLILDELHTYRGRQGADVALLVRRLRERLQASELVCIGTSATMSSTGSLADRNKTVAEVASKLFGAGITEQDIIGETLERVTDPLKDVAAVQANLAGAVVRTQFTWADFEAFRIDPLSIWVELNLGIELPDNEPPRRAKPMTIQAASEKLAKDAGCEIDAARLALKQFLVAAHEIRTPQGRPPFAFKLHQFISGPGKVLATLEAQGIRHVTLDAQRFAPGRQDEGAQLYPVHFCRDCGQEYLPVWQSKRAPTTYTPREIDDITADDNEDVHYGFLCLATSNLPYRGDIEDLPETWLDPSRDQPKIKQNYKKAVPYSVIVDVQGNEGCGESFWYIPGKFRFCLNCGQLHEVHGFDDHWQALRIVFKGLSEGESHLDLPALGGLFATSQCPALDAASLDNAHLLAAIQNLRWASHKGVLAPVDYRNMGPEELGSVYESLLELVPEIDLPARKFGFVGLTSEGSTAGNARKLSGSYYTPDSLVQELIKSALDPVIEQRIAAQPESPVEALLAIRVIDPACGSGHFLLAAARRLAEKLAQLRATDGEQTEQDFRHALREVVSRCIFGVDRNPMAIELARTALWLEGFEEGRPLGFLDHHLQVGDALLGVTDLKALELGIAKDAFKPLSGDDKEVCKQLAKVNAAALKDLEKKRKARAFGQLDVAGSQDSGLKPLQALEALPENSTQEIAVKEAAYRAFLEQAKTSRLAHAADLLVGAYLLPKREGAGTSIPTSATLYLTLEDVPLPADQQGALAAAQTACAEARVLHWPLAFPQVFASGGFDCVLGNPPWEVMQMGEEEFFATRAPHIAELAGDKRKRAITELPETEPRLWIEYETASQRVAASNNFVRESGRYPLTAVGKLNTYPLFAETISQITHASGRAGFIVPTGIATDDSTKAFFGQITQKGRLISLFDIENRDKLFAAVDSRMKFCLLTLGQAGTAEFVCFAAQVNQLADTRRRFRLTPSEFRLINPNTLTCPVFRSERDAELTKKLYRAAPVLIEEGNLDGNPWGISFSQGLFNMTSDSQLFFDQPVADSLPLYEAKMIHQFDHRWATYTAEGDSRDVSDSEKADPAYAVTPRYWVNQAEVEERLVKRDREGNVIWSWDRQWLMGWRDICRATDERTVIASVVGRVGVGHTMPLFMTSREPVRVAALLANFGTLILDFCARVKVGGTHLTYGYLKQFPILPPKHYTEADLAFITPRVLELTYTAHDLQPWAQDLGFDGEPFAFNPTRRAILRAELDAYYAKLYGLTRDELRYILDPADIMGVDYPSETFRVLKNKEQREYGEYRTQRLVLEAWDKLENGELH